MKVNQWLWAFLFLAVSMVVAQQAVSPNGTKTMVTNMDNILPSHRLHKNFFDSIPTNNFGSIPNETNQPVTPKWQAPESDIRAFFEETKTKAEQGDVDAQYSLAEAYRGNLWTAFVEHDPKTNNSVTVNEIVKWLRKAAEQGHLKAQKDLASVLNQGGFFFEPNVIEKNPSEAAKWYLRAAQQGDPESQCSIGTMYEYGEGVLMDYAEAVKWYRKAANQGNAGGQGLLGFMYCNGKGVPKNYIEAYKWFNIASANSSDWLNLVQKKAADARDELAKQMTPEQIAEAQHHSAEYVSRQEGKPVLPDFSSKRADSRPTATGTGFFITDDGYLVSNYHVVKGAAKVRVQTSAGLIDATVVKVDAANDLALLKAVGRFASLPIAASRTVKLGGTVATVGFPDIGLQGFSPKLAKGEIASLSGAADDPCYFQISVPVQPGNSGGALVDAHGNVVGIVAAKLSARAALDATGALPEDVNYAVKSSLLLSFLESVPDVASKLKEPNTKDEAFEDVVKSAQDAAVLVLVY